MRFVTLVKLLLAAAAAFAIAVVAVVKTIDIDQYRLLVTDVLYAATGRGVEIGGDFEFELSWTPRIVATDVRIANPPGAKRPDLLRVARVEAEIGLFPLLRREVEVRSLTLTGPDLALEIDEAGRPNWLLRPVAEAGTPRRERSGLPLTHLSIHRVTVADGRLSLQDRSTHRLSVLTLTEVSIGAEAPTTPIAFAATGEWGGLPLEVSGTVGSFAELHQQTRPFPVKLQASAGANHLLAEGGIDGLADLSGLAVDVALQGNAVAEAGRLAGLRVPALGPYRASLRLSGSAAAPRLSEIDAAVGRKEALLLGAKGKIEEPLRRRGLHLVLTAESDKPAALSRLLEVELPLHAPLRATGTLRDAAAGWRLDEVSGSVGRTDIAGDVVYDPGEASPGLTIALASRRVVLEDFGITPAPPPRAKGQPLFSDDALLPLTGLTTMDVALTWRADAVLSQDTVLSRSPGEALLNLRGGVMAFRPFTAAVASLISVTSSSPDGTRHQQ